ETTKTVANLTHPGGPNERGDVLRYTVSATNTGQDNATNLEVRDTVPEGATYVPGSLRILTGPGPPSPTDAVGDDQAEFSPSAKAVTFRLGQGATASSGGVLTTPAQPANSTSFSFDVSIDGDLPVGYELVNRAAASFIAQSLGTQLSALTPNVTTIV